jgi:quinolinate synthase
MSEIAKQSQHPHSYRVLAELMTSLVNANEHVLDLHAQKQDIQPTLTPEANKPLIGNAMFVGSTAELLTMLNQQRKANN